MPKLDSLARRATTRRSSVTADWHYVQPGIEGVVIKEVRPVLGGGGALMEVWRADWQLDGAALTQVFAKLMAPAAISGWHVHQSTTDRLFVVGGQARVVLYDGRIDSRSHGQVAEFVYGAQRPALIVIPPGVWHALRNESGSEMATVLNLVDQAYHYEAPDHLALPIDDPAIPYRFSAR